jgi:hypothetical protein
MFQVCLPVLRTTLMNVLLGFAAAAQHWSHNSKLECFVILLHYNHVSVVFTLACAGCGLRYNAVLQVAGAVVNALKLTSLDVGPKNFEHSVLLENYKLLDWQKHGMAQPHQAIITECSLNPSRSWIYVLHHNQRFRFCHLNPNHLLHLNLRLQCNAARLYVPPPPLPSSLNHHLAAPGAVSPALALSTTQRRRLLCLSGHTLSLLQLLMRSPHRRGAHRHGLHQALKRVSSTATASNLFDIITQCVYIKAPGQPFSAVGTQLKPHFLHALMARPSYTISALKDKMMRIVGAAGLSRDLRFHFAGAELQNERSLSQCGIAPNDTLEVTLALSGEMQIFVKTLTGLTFTVEMNASDSLDLLRIKMWVLTGLPPSEMRLIFHGNMYMEYDRSLSDNNIHNQSTVHMMERLKGGLGFFVSALDVERHRDGASLPASSSPGAQWVMRPTLPSPLPPPVAVAALVRSFMSQAAAASSAPRIPNASVLPPYSCLTKQACDTLIQRVDHAHASVYTTSPQNEPGLRPSASCGELARDLVSSNCESDFRLLLCVQELLAIVGDSAYSRILSALEAHAPDAIVIRRTVATGSWIDFHTDTVARTVQVLLYCKLSLFPILLATCLTSQLLNCIAVHPSAPVAPF